MSQVIVQINGRNYTMQCDDGQEEHLRALAAMVDGEVANIRAAAGQLGDLRLLIMASLVIADKLTEAERQIGALREQLQGLRAERDQAASAAAELGKKALHSLDDASLRLETLAETAKSFIEAPAGEAAPDADADKARE